MSLSTFPKNPTAGQTYNNNGTLWTFDGTKWKSSVSSGIAQVYDIEAISTGYFDLPSGNTAQRPGSPPTGALRYNSTTGFAEVYTSVGWGSFGAQPPSISTVTPATYNGDAGTTFTINGANFTADATVKFVDVNSVEYTAAVVTFVNSGTLTATTPQDFTVAQEPLDVKVIQASGQVVKLDCIDCGGTPTWTTAGGNIWTNATDVAVNIQLQATDPDSGALTYTITTGTLPSGVTMSSSGLISGTPNISVTTTFNFTVRATDVGGNTADRAFSITIYPLITTATSYPLSSGQYSLYTTGWTSSSANLYDLTHLASTFTVPANVYAIRVAVWGGGAVFNNAVSGGNGGYTDTILRVNPGDRFKVIVANAGTIGNQSGGSGGSGMGGGCSQDGNDNGTGGAGSGVFFAANSSLTTVTVEATMFSKGVVIAGGGGCAGQANPGYAGGNGNGGGSATAITIAGISGFGVAGGSGTGPNNSNGGKANGSGGDMINFSNAVAVTGPARGLGGGRLDDGYGSSCGAGAGGGSGAGGGGGGCPIAWSGTGENATGDGGRGVTFYNANQYNTNTGPGAGGSGSYQSMGGNGMRFNGINLAGGGGGGHGASNAGGGWGGGGSAYYAWGGGGGSGCAFGYLTGTTPTLTSWVNPNSVTVNGGNANAVCGVPTTAGASKGSSTSGLGYNGAVLIMW